MALDAEHDWRQARDVGWWIALGVLLIAALAVWELRGYLAELNRTLRSEAAGDRTLAPREPDPVSRRSTS